MIKLIKGLPEYDADMRNGVQSKSRAGDTAGKALVFTKMEDESMVTLNGAFAGMKVDLFDKAAQKWLPGTIDKVTRASLKDVRIKVLKDGFPPEFAVDV